MANPPSRRTSTSYPNTNHHYQLPISSDSSSPNSSFPFPTQAHVHNPTLLNSLKLFLKKPHAFPFLLFIFLFLTWVSLRFHRNPHPSTSFALQSRPGGGNDRDANLVRFQTVSSDVFKDKRGWLVDPVSLALRAGVSGGAMSCSSIHVGEIRPGGMRGNHRHRTCNETFVIWGAKTLFRLENNAVDKGYAEVTVEADEVAVAASPSGTAHALLNIDILRSTFFLGCQDSIINYNDSTTDFRVWKDL